jgi:hypothetical protein
MLIISGTPDQDSESPSKLMLTHVPCLAKNAMETLSGEWYFVRK